MEQIAPLLLGAEIQCNVKNSGTDRNGVVQTKECQHSKANAIHKGIKRRVGRLLFRTDAVFDEKIAG